MSDQTPADETKLTRTKRRWAEEGKFLTGRHAALPPEGGHQS